MMKQTVDSIRKTELEAKRMVEDAAQQVAEKREAAYAETKKNQEAAIAKAKSQAIQVMTAAKAKGDAIVEASQKEAVKEANALRAKAAQNEAAAIKLVIEHLV